MGTLTVKLLGPFQVLSGDQPLTEFESDRVRALLCYLAVEADRPHRREHLAALLWPDWPERSARTNLRRALSNLRKVIHDQKAEPPYLEITRQSIQLNSSSDIYIDAQIISKIPRTEGGEEIDVNALEEAIALYRGDFLEGFAIADSVAFENWVSLTRERLRRQIREALKRLAQLYEKQGETAKAVARIRRLLELEPLLEDAHRHLMRLFALSGQRSAALAQYELCRTLLDDELGLEPSIETRQLYEEIKSSEIISPAAEGKPRSIRGYALRERLADGRFGEVYRAHGELGREVAIRIIPPRYANHPEFIRNFEQDAQRTARLEHPNIATLYDYWREPGGAFLVTRWIKGSTLWDWVQEEPWDLERIARLVDQIADALTLAHQQGVIHGNLNPGNILIDEQGNANLVDFGIENELMTLSPAEERDAATDARQYLPPENLRGLGASETTDIYSFGVILFELFSGVDLRTVRSLADFNANGSLPELQRLRAEVRAPVEAMIRRAMAESPEDRYATPCALSQDLLRALSIDRGPVSAVDRQNIVGPKNPFKGLLPFFEEDADDFFGRDGLIDRLVGRLHREDDAKRFLALVGPSGSGKSSVVRAGLIPALRRGALEGSKNWYVIQMLPGEHPLEELETALLRIAVNPPERLIHQMQEGERGILRAVKRSLPDDKSELLFFIDQFEELFTLVADEVEREHFLRSLTTAIRDPRSRLRVILTLRADYYDRPLRYPDFGKLLHTHMETVLPLTPAELERAISGPLERQGVDLEPGLASHIVTDFATEPGALPLLQYALTELFEHRQDRLLTSSAYQDVGGVSGALRRSAERVYQGLDEEGKHAAKQMFLRLVRVGESAEYTRRRVLQAEIRSLSRNAQPVMENFGDARLLSFDRDPETRGPTVEVAHEALLREWSRLRDWLEDSRADLRMQGILRAAADEWREAKRDNGFLLRGSRVDQFERWRETSGITLTKLEDEFLGASLADRDLRRKEEEARRKKELEAAQRLAQAESKRAEDQAKSSIRLRRLVIGLGLILLVALVATVLAIQQSALAEARSRVARSRELAAAAVSSLDSDPELSILLAMQAVSTTYDEDGVVIEEAESALHQAIQESHIRGTISEPGSFAFMGEEDFDTSGVMLMAPTGNGGILFYSPEKWARDFKIMGHNGEVIAVSPSPYGKLLAIGDARGVGRIWDYYELIRKYEEENFQIDLSKAEPQGELMVFSPHLQAITNIAFNQDGTLMATSSKDDTAVVWDLVKGKSLITLQGHKGDVVSVVFDPSGRYVATASLDQTAKVWDLATGEIITDISGHEAAVLDVRFNWDGTQLATASEDGTAKLWDVETGNLLVTFRGHSGAVRSLGFDKKGPYLGTGGDDATARIWDIRTGDQVLVLEGHKGPIYDVLFNYEEHGFLTSSYDGSQRLWDILPEYNGEWLTLVGHRKVAFDVNFSPDGRWVATASWDGSVILWDGLLGSKIRVFDGHDGEVTAVNFDPDGRRLVTSSFDGSVKIWDRESGKEMRSIATQHGRILDVIFSADGTQVYSAGEDGRISVWNASTGEEVRSWATGSRLVNRMALSPDGSRIVSAGSDGLAKVWDATTGELLLTLSGHSAEVLNVSYSPDGTRIATAGGDGLAKVWDASTGEELLALTGHGTSVWAAAFSPDGTGIATMSLDKTAKLWDSETGEELLTLYDYNDGRDLAFSPDGNHLAVTASDGSVRIYVLPIDDLMKLASIRVTRDFTEQECQRYLHLAECPADE